MAAIDGENLRSGSYFLNNLRVSARLLIVVLAFMLWGLVGSLLAFQVLREIQVGGPIYTRLVEGKDLVADILPPPKYIVESNLIAHELFLADKSAEISALEQRLLKLKDEYDARQTVWSKAGLEDALSRPLVVESHEPAQKFYQTAFSAFIPALKAGNRDSARVHLTEMQRHYEEHRKAIDVTVVQANKYNTVLETLATDAFQSGLLKWLGIAGTMSLAVFALSFAIARGITRPLGETVQVVRAIADGDLTRPVPPGQRDETGQLLTAMGDMQAKLRTLVNGIQHEARELSGAAQELSAASDLSSRTSHAQSEAAASMAASVSAMSESIEEVGKNACTAQSTAQLSGEQSKSGGEVIRAAVNDMRAITDSVNTSARTITELDSYTTEISTIVGVIREIADQTNLLALNAAIEAARAGEQGRGFAVVADEVRKLAERTAQSTQQIGTMINKVQNGARQAVSAMESGVARVNEGLLTAQRAGESIVGIQKSADCVVQVVQDIAIKLKEQSTASQKIAHGVEHIANMAGENTASVMRTAAAANQMQTLAATLTRSAGRFQT